MWKRQENVGEIIETGAAKISDIRLIKNYQSKEQRQVFVGIKKAKTR